MHRLLYFLFFISFSSQAQLIENFDDGDFTNNPIWSGDATSFQVLSGQLNSTNTIASSSFYLSTPTTTVSNAQWEIFMNLKFPTSGVNYVDVYFISDKQDIMNAGSGYFVRVGGTPDEISLYRNDAGTITKIIDGADGRSETSPTNNYIKLKITRDALNVFTLTDSIVGATPVEVIEGTATDANYQSSSYFGIAVHQSVASFFGKHYFDNIYAGVISVDNISPTISNVSVIDQNNLDVTFSEPLNAATANVASNYSADNGIGNPTSASLDGGNSALVHLQFANSFSDGIQNVLTVNNISDVAGNLIAPNSTINFTYFAAVVAVPFDVVISEIMAAPAANGLPLAEYFEIYNRSNKALDLAGWSVTDANLSPAIFSSMQLLPGEYAVVCDDAFAADFASFGKVIYVSSMPSLNNSGDDLSIYDANALLIDEVIYDLTYYHDAVKEQGGWSMEKVDLNFPCANANNWKATLNGSGGTPATINSVNGTYADAVKPYIKNAFVINPTLIEVQFSEPMNKATIQSTTNYSIDNGIGNPTSITITTTDNSKVQLTFSSPLQPGTIYHLTVNNMSDCAGNVIDNSVPSLLGIAEAASKNDVLINEILFNSYSGGYDFVELYNHSNKVIDLSTLNICNADEITGQLQTINPISADGLLLFPNQYLALTESASDILNRYYSSNPKGVIQIADLPTYNDDEGRCVIADVSGIRIDDFYYNAGFQYPLITDAEGKSLERISFDRPTQDSSNWITAASTVNYATPAYKNSQYAEASSTSNQITIEPETFSPDNDGYNDVLNIRLNFEDPGLVANIQVYDSRGRLIQYLMRNELIGEKSQLSWNGTNLENQKAAVGIYILYTEVFSQNGDVKKYKNAFVLATKVK